MRRASVFKKDIFRFALTCAVIVGSVAFSANSAMAAEIDISKDGEGSNGIREASYYADGNILNIRDNIIISDDLPAISGAINIVVNGNNYTVQSNSSSNYNYGYQLSNGAHLELNNLTFENLGRIQNVGLGSSTDLYSYGAGLHIQDGISSAILNNVSFTGSFMEGEGNPEAASNLYGAAISNSGNLNITGGTFSGNSLSSTEREFLWFQGSGGDAHGGAIYNTGESLTLTETTISNNSVSSTNHDGSASGKALGGGIYTTKDITLAGGNTFSGNTDQNGARANDIYFAGGSGLLVNGTGSNSVNTISSGLASENDSSKITLSDGGKLLLNGDNSDFLGKAYVGSNSTLTYGGTLNNALLGQTIVSENGGTVEIAVDNENYSLSADRIVTNEGIAGRFVKSGNADLSLASGDYSGFTGDIIINGGSLTFDDANGSYFNAVSNQINDSILNFTNNGAAKLNQISGTGSLNKNGSGILTVDGDNSGFTGTARINEGNLTFNGLNGGKFFANNADVVLNGSTLDYTAQSAVTNLNNDNFADIVFDGNALLNYTSNSGTTHIYDDFYTVNSGSPNISFTGNSNADFVLNDNLDGINQVTFKNTTLSLADGLSALTGTTVLDNTALNLLDQVIKDDYTFSNLTAQNNSSLRLDVSLGADPVSDKLTFTGGSGVLNITNLGILADNGEDYPKTVQVINNTAGSSVSLVDTSVSTVINPTIAGWSTNVYEYLINATQSENSQYYDSLTFAPQAPASPDSLKKMNNYRDAQVRGFSLVENSPVYHIARDLEQTEYGTFTVNGTGKENSTISGFRVSYTENDDGTYSYGDVTTDRGSFFELTDTKGAVELNISNITIKDADRTLQAIPGGSIIYSDIENAVINIEDAAFKDSHSVGVGGAFDIENAASVNIKGSDFTNLTSGAHGGAIYSAVDLNITNSNFSSNTDLNGKNDITLANGANVLFTVENGQTSNMSSGLKTMDNSTASTFTKAGEGKLNISGQNSGYKGNVAIKEGTLVFDTVDSTDSFFGYSTDSNINIVDGASLVINNTGKASLSGGHFAGEGGITMNTDNFTLYGNNGNYKGNALLNGTELAYIAEKANDAIFGGTVQLIDGASVVTLAENSLDYTGGNFSSNNDSASFTKNDSGKFTLVGDNSGFVGIANLNAGETDFVKGSDTSFFGGDVVLDSVLNYTANANETLNGVFSGNGTLNKDGAQTLTLAGSTFAGTANIFAGALEVTSAKANASDFDFTANISNNATLKYTAGENSSLTLGGANNKLNFITGAQGATADITASNIVLDTIANASGNNIIINDADVVLAQANFNGNYTIKNSTLDLMGSSLESGTTTDYVFDSFSTENSNLTVDVSLLENNSDSDTIVIKGAGSGDISISNFAIIDDDGTGTKSVQVIQNSDISNVGLRVDQDTKMADWSTNVYEYEIQASKSNETANYYDSLLFDAVQAATSDSLRKMNHEKEGLRGFSVVTTEPYRIGQDLDTTLAGTFTVVGKNKETSIISGQRADGYESFGTNGSFFEVVNDTNLTISDITIRDAQRQNQTISGGSVLYLNNNIADVTIEDVILTENKAAGNGGAIAAIAGNSLNISNTDFTNNKSESLGGAIYTETEISIMDSKFSGNTDSTGSNDIYVAQYGVVNFNGYSTTTISGGISGNGRINKEDSGTLNLSGNNSEFSGTLNVASGIINFIANDEDDITDSYISGVTSIGNGANAYILNTSASALNINGTFAGEGRLNIGDGNSTYNSVTINGNNSAFEGNAYITNGQLIVKIDDENDAYFAENALTFVNNGILTFDIGENINKTIQSTGYNNFVGTSGLFEKTGAGNLAITGDWSNMYESSTKVSGGTLEFVAADKNSSMISGNINVLNDAVFKVTNNTSDTWDFTNTLIGESGTVFEVAANDSTIDISSGNHSGFLGETLISSGNLAFTKNDTNSFVAGGVNVADNSSKLTYTTTYTDDVISVLKGTGTLDKQGSGNLTVSTDGFTGLADINAGTLTVNAQAQNEGADGTFEFGANVASNSTLSYIAGSATDIYNINSDSKFEFDGKDGVINFVNGNYNVSSDLVNASGNTTGFNNAVVNITGGNDVTLNGNYTLTNSGLDLVDNNITTTVIESLTASGNNSFNLDFDFVGENGSGAFDTLIANSGNAQLELNSINSMNLDGDKGLINSVTYDVLNGLTFANNYNSELESSLYKYTISASQGGTQITVASSGYVGNTLFTMNHLMDGDRTFHLAGESTDYYIGQNLDKTLAGTLNITGRTQDRKDTITATENVNSPTGLSMFEIFKDNTTLNIKDITIQKASSANGGSVIYQDNENSIVNVTNSTLQSNVTNVDGGAVSISNGTATFDDVTFRENSADRAGALRVRGGNVTVKNSTFADNNAYRYGGAISTPHSKSNSHSEITLAIENTDFSNNTASQGGGAISFGDLITATISDSKFEKNSVQNGNGGAIYNEGATLTLTGVEFNENTAQRGSAIYNLGTATVTDAMFSGNSPDNYIYNGSNGVMTITATGGDYDLTNNAVGSTITNNGVLNLIAAQGGYKFTLVDELSGSDTENMGTVNTSGIVNFNNVVTNSIVNVTNGILVINGIGNEVDAALNNSNLNIYAGTSASLGDKNVLGGTINVLAGTDEAGVPDGFFNINNSRDISISADLSGAGVINKLGTGTVALSGNSNDSFSGDLKITEGIVSFVKTSENTFFDSSASIDISGSNSKFEYSSTEVNSNFDDTFANVSLNGGGTVSISGTGMGASTYNLDSGWLVSNGTTANKLVFNDASYVLNTLYNHAGVNDDIAFNNTNVSIGSVIKDLSGANYTLTNSTLDLSNNNAGDNYIFDRLVFDGNSNGLTLDVNLHLEHDGNNNITIAPYADTITAGEGSTGVVEITKMYITDDNGSFITNQSGELTKGVIQVFKGDKNQLQVADENDARILSWATNVYKYGIKSAQKDLIADSVEIMPEGESSTDTLRDLNIYDPNNNQTGGNRGFSFIAENGLQEKNNYNIYRDLDTTSAGNFSVVGTLAAETTGGDKIHKSILSGKLENLVLLESENSGNLKQINANTWEYNGDAFDAAYLTQTQLDGDIQYTIDVKAFTPDNQTNGSMFEIVNNTIFEMTDVSVQDAKRYATDSIKDGSVIHANNQDAKITLGNVDFVNNSAEAGNGGAVANVLSSQFILNQTIIRGNTASGNGGAIYNTSNGMQIVNATVDGNKASGLGGAIYTSSDMKITDSTFGGTELNYHGSGQNDIYIANNAEVEFVTGETLASAINSGIAGEAGTVFNKTGASTLNLSGNNEDFNGTFEISTGSVNYTANDANDSFVGGSVMINKDATLVMNIAASDETTLIKDQIMQNVSGGLNGSGNIIKNGAGTLKLAGANSSFTGETTINEGSVIYNAVNGTDSYFGGSTTLASADANLTLNIGENAGNQTISDVSGVQNSIIDKLGEGQLSLSGDSSNFLGTANVKEGKLVYMADDTADKYFGGSTVISGNAELEANIASQDNEGNAIIDQTIGNISGGEGTKFTKTGEGEILLVGDNSSFTGTTTISEGILSYISGTGSYVKGNTIINTDGTLEYTVLTDSDDLAAISGAGTLDKLGAGTLNLVGDNSEFKGNVDITGGKLAYTTTDGSKFINADTFNIAQNAALVINNSTDDVVNISNLNPGQDEAGQTGSGNVIKDGDGTLNLGGNNSTFEGILDINSGNVTFNKNDDTVSYIAGTTDIASGAALNYNTTGTDSINNVVGSGSLNKGGTGTLTFDAAVNGVDSSFTANANEGSLNVIGKTTDAFDFNMIANNSAILNYVSAVGSNHTIGGAGSVVGFGVDANNAQINFSSNTPTEGTYILAGDIANNVGNQVSFDKSTLKLADSDYTYKGSYSITYSVIDLSGNGTNETTFDSLTTSNSSIKIDVNLTLPHPASDVLISNGGNGGALELALKEITLVDSKTDNGLGNAYNINVLGGNLTLNNNDTLEHWTTSAYQYKVDIVSGGKDIVLTAVKASDNNSLKAMNQYDPDGDKTGGNRGFQFNEKDDSPYVIESSLGETTAGSFIVTGNSGDSATIISGEDTKSFFEVVNDTDLTVKNVTIQDAYSGTGGSVVVANNDSANVIIDNLNITSNSSDGNGGIINNINSESFTITDSNITNNTSGGLGGAIYTETNITITDTDFSGNSDKNGKNDIYAAGENAIVNVIAANKDVSVSSGIAGDGTVNKSGSKDLSLSGKNDEFTGNLNITEGNLNYTQKENSDTYISGNTNIAENSAVNITNDYSAITAGSFSGNGTLNKDGSEDITLSGDNSQFAGTMNINDGSVIYNADNTTYISGTTNINPEGTLAVNTSSNASLSNINGSGTVDKNGAGTLIFSGNNTFNGSLNINEGAFGIASGASLGSLANAKFAAGTGINLQNTSVVDLGDGTYTTNPSPASIENLYFESLTLLGDVNLDIDIDLQNQIADKVGAGKVYGNGSLILGQDSLNVVSDTLLQNTSVQVAYGDLANYVTLSQGVSEVMGPIQKYNVSYNNGNLSFASQGGNTPDIGSVNPAVMASSVATQLGGYLTQLHTLNAGFYHMDRYTKYPHMLRVAAENTNKYAINEAPVYRRSNLPETSSAMWIEPYTTFESVNLKGGIDVSNVAYGTMYGGDTDLVDLGNGFKGVISAFVGYNGSHMSFNGISMNQQGGALGMTGTLYKGNFFTGLTVSTGASAGEAYTQYGTDNFAMLTAGIASKTGYNWEIKEGKFIVQPSLFLGYTFANTFDYTSAAGVRMDSDPLHAITVVPGVKFIANLENGWQPYMGANMVWNIMDKTNVVAQDVRLPQLSVKPYVEYGVGVQKSWGERFTVFFQTMIRNGGRAGVVLSAGFRWALGKDPNVNKQDNKLKTQRKVIKSMK